MSDSENTFSQPTLNQQLHNPVHHPALFTAVVAVVGLMLVLAGLVVPLGGQPALAQTFIEPTNPLGGVTAAPLNSSNSIQRKAGSLIIGAAGGSSRICLNSDSVVSNNYNLCIASWGELGNLVGNYVVVNQDTWAGGNPGAAAQTGYVRVKASAANNQLYTVIAEANTLANSAAVYAWDSGNVNAFAGYFNGRLYVGDGTATSAKKLCLNDTVDLGPATGGKGCITTWTGVSNQLNNAYVFLQSAPGSLTVQVGGEALTGAGVFGTDPTKNGGVVLGTPAAGANLCYTCGDGICSAGETGGAAGNCRVGFQPAGCPNVPNPPGGDCAP